MTFFLSLMSTTHWQISDDNALMQVIGLVTASTEEEDTLLLQRPLDASVPDKRKNKVNSRNVALVLVKVSINLTLIVICRRQQNATIGS